MANFTASELKLLRRLKTPAQVQDFLNRLPANFEPRGLTVKSPLRVLRTGTAHCLEGALLGAYILSLQGRPPLILHLESTRADEDHIVALFKENGYWGALSKTNHAVLRYREPVYKTLRELVLSYFHEYFLADGRKTLRRYSRPLNLNEFEDGWPTMEEDLWGIEGELDLIKHYDIAPPANLRRLRRADPLERAAGKLVEWPKKKQI